jgi:hypothetical protein
MTTTSTSDDWHIFEGIYHIWTYYERKDLISDIHEWLIETVGEELEDWTLVVKPSDFIRVNFVVGFKDERFLTLFKLTWVNFFIDQAVS